jgi:hypothetical protein
MKIQPPAPPPASIRDDWSTTPGGFIYEDDGSTVKVMITSREEVPAQPARPAIPPNPTSNPPYAGRAAVAAVAAIPATSRYGPFLLWGPNTPTTYAQANAMNNGVTFSTADLVAAIAAYLASITLH